MSATALKMPTGYVGLEREEMEYIDGGYYMSNSELKALLVTAGVILLYVGAFATTAANAISEGKGMYIRVGFPAILNFSVG